MKKYSITKIGYTKGIYGCCGEYFKLYISNSEKYTSLVFEGIYTDGQYIGEYLKSLGYTHEYSSVPYGQLKRKDLKNWDIPKEQKALEKIKNIDWL